MLVVAALTMAGESYATQRKVVSLDGQWEIAQGSMERIPQEFPAKVIVPGMVDLAVPAFEEVGVASERREAFWYRKTFKLDGPLPETARLKIHKAKFGKRVFVNGKEVGEHLPCFTPGYFDVSDVLRGNAEENEVIVRIGATEKQLPDHVPYGFDFEKEKYIPGIFDSVELILSSNPRVENIQTVPDPEEDKLTVRVEVVNDSPVKKVFDMAYTVREKKSGRRVIQFKIGKNGIDPGQKLVLHAKLDMAGSKHWTPETPFLYTMTASTGTDELTQT
ncbi:MAG: hypothetical protein DRP64_12570, partial [Verrucomicrobia bacterium]